MEIIFLDRQDFKNSLPQLVDLFKACYSKKVHHYYSADYFKWRQLENPFRECLTGVVIDQGKIVASYSVFPCLMTIDREERRAVLGLNAATHPDYIRKGYLNKLVKALSEYVADRGYEIIIGFPNSNSHRIFVTKLGRKDVYEIPTMVMDLDSSKSILPVTVAADNQFQLNYERFASPDTLNSIQKNQPYLKWRYADNPVERYSNFVLHKGKYVRSFMVVKKYLEKLNIIDFQAYDRDDGDVLLQQAINYAHSLKLSSVTTWAPRHTFYHILCEKRGFINSNPITYFTVKDLTDGKLKLSTNYSDWYIQQGDFNAY